MVDLWFVLVCAMFAAYVVLDGYDLGAGIVAPFVAKTHHERKIVLHTILPFWDGNEVFLVAGGATLYLAFPRLFPTFASGFYLPVMLVLWLLALRGLAIEMRHKFDQPLWNDLWDGSFHLSSLGLAGFFGAALGNIVRGVSIDETGAFFAPLWTDFRVGASVGVLDWYTVLVGLTAAVMLARHGTLRLAMHVGSSDGAERAIHARCLRLASLLAVPSGLMALVTTVASIAVQPNIQASLLARPWIALAPALGMAGFVGSVLAGRRGHHTRAFQGSSVELVGLFASACVGLYPYGILARDPARSILAKDAAADGYALAVALWWWLPGMTGVVAYSIFAHRRMIGSHRTSTRT